MTDRDKRFAEEYIVDLNASAAAIRAGYSPKTAKDAAAWIREDNPQKPQVKAMVERLMAERSRRTGITADRVLTEIAKIAFVNADDVIDFESGKVKQNAKRVDKAAIQSITNKTGKIEEHEVKLMDKTRALELLGKHLGMFTENLKVDGAVPVIHDDV